MPAPLPEQRAWTVSELAVLDAVRACCERWGMTKTTIDDIARESGVSRASLYRMFPGGRDVLFEAMRVRELDDFFAVLLGEIDGIDNLHELLARVVSVSLSELHGDEHLAAMLASEPGEIIANMTVEGLPRILRVATTYMGAIVDPFLPRPQARQLIDVTVRLVISYFLAPNVDLDLRDELVAHAFIAPFLPESQRRPLPDSERPQTDSSHITEPHTSPNPTLELEP